MRYWKRISLGQTTTVESYSHDLDIEGAVEIDPLEFEQYKASLHPTIPIDPLKEQFQSASTIADKVNIIAKKVGFI